MKKGAIGVNVSNLSTRPPKQDFLSIQVLRGVAALSVVIFHALMRFGIEFSALSAGVDIFFVISGFVMVASTEGKSLSPAAILVAAMGIGLTVLLADIQSARTITGGIPSALIVASAVGLEHRLSWGAFKPALLVGNASYALYLFHGLFIDIIIEFVPKSAYLTGPIIFTLTAVAGSLIIYFVVEKPIMNFMKNRSRRGWPSKGHHTAKTNV
jgi:exopolysaccharide production protein ExoZ